MRVLVIWQEVPDTVKAYTFQDPDPETWEKLQLCNGHLINATDDDHEALHEALQWLNTALEKMTPTWGEEASEAGTMSALTGPFDFVIVTGFLL